MSRNSEPVRASSEELARWLIEYADEALRGVQDIGDDPYKLTMAFRKKFTPDQAGALSKLHELRSRGRAKFAKADEMFFTQVGYEQSSSQALASYKAARFRGCKVVDLCCGIGGDAIWLARQADRLCIVDLSGAAIRFAEANVGVHGCSVEKEMTDVRRMDFGAFDAWHLDPDRRVDGRRKSSPNACEPPLDEFLALSGLPSAGAIKLSPAADAIRLLEQGAELEWIGCHHECRQLVVWLGELARHPGHRTATWISGKQYEDGQPFEQIVEPSTAMTPKVLSCEAGLEAGRYFYEPRASVLAARLTDTLAFQFSLTRILDSDYLVSDLSVDSLLFRRFRILDAFSFHQKELIRRLTQSKLRATEVKTRGVDVQPESLLKKLSSATSRFDQPASVILVPDGASIRCVIAARDESK